MFIQYLQPAKHHLENKIGQFPFPKVKYAQGEVRGFFCMCSEIHFFNEPLLQQLYVALVFLS